MKDEQVDRGALPQRMYTAVWNPSSIIDMAGPKCQSNINLLIYSLSIILLIMSSQKFKIRHLVSGVSRVKGYYHSPPDLFQDRGNTPLFI